MAGDRHVPVLIRARVMATERRERWGKRCVGDEAFMGLWLQFEMKENKPGDPFGSAFVFVHNKSITFPSWVIA